tara:strand:+ start:2303 stop:2500 length:198 start_codon:yes stop_codon:yes gene_type:complete
MNLMEGLQQELNRVRELREAYKQIGAPGVFALSFINNEIQVAENAIAKGDTIQMMVSFTALKDCN